MDAALKFLASSGTTGAILTVSFGLLASIIGVLGWVLKRLVDGAIKQQDKFSEFMEALTKSLGGIGLNCQAHRSDTMAAVRDCEANISAKIDHSVWAAHDKLALLHDKALAAAASMLSTEITGAAQSIRTGNKDLLQEIENRRLRDQVDELSRPTHITPTPGVVR
jgi:uncharacterized membrane-anchored protein YhcB (DUF1043 family)